MRIHTAATIALLASATLITGSVSAPTAHAEQFTIASEQDGKYCIHSPNETAGARLVINRCYAPTPRFDFTSLGQLRPERSSTLCVDGLPPSGITLAPCMDFKTQLWEYTPDHQLRNKAGWCIDIPHGDVYPSAPLDAYGCHTGINQRWSLRDPIDCICLPTLDPVRASALHQPR
jgi:ricin-type beta-trefoil lectin protein